MIRLNLAAWRARPALAYGAVVLLSLLIVIALDALTNELNTTYYKWDFWWYYQMAEHGLIDNDELVAPLAYRFATPLLAGAIADGFATTTKAGFTVIAYAGAIAQLALVWVLAQRLGASGWRAWVSVAVVAGSLYNVKFLLFDVSRPDHLAHPLMLAAILVLWDYDHHPRRSVIGVSALSSIGLLVREFLIIPPILLLVRLTGEYRRTRSREILLTMGAVLVITSLVVIVPRALIPVQASGQYIDPQHRGDALKRLLEAPSSERRDFNMFFNLVSYTLPAWLLLTPGRVRRAWANLAGYRSFLGVYSGVVLMLALYGGTDIWRFMTFLFIPLVLVLTTWLRHGDVDPAEVGYMLVVVARYNKIFQDIPNLLDPYLDFYGGYDNRINSATFERLYELAAYGVGMWVLRGLLTLARRRASAAPPHKPAGTRE